MRAGLLLVLVAGTAPGTACPSGLDVPTPPRGGPVRPTGTKGSFTFQPERDS